MTPKPRKYRNEPTVLDGQRFDSRRELNRWLELRLLERAGEIRELQRQVAYELVPAQRDWHGQHVRAVRYVADFVYRTATGVLIVEDAKGIRTPEYRLKAMLMLWRHGITVIES